MSPVEREPQQVERKEPRIEIRAQEWFPFLRHFHIDDFPAGPFLVACAIIGGVSTYGTGSFVLTHFQYDKPEILTIWGLLGTAFGIAFGIKFINWLADNSPD